MSYVYKYLGDLQTVFIHLRKDNATWAPHKGDTITLTHPIAHPLLELVKDEPAASVVADDKDDEDESADEDDEDTIEPYKSVVPLMTA